MRPIPLHGLRLSSAIWLPVLGVVGTPLPRAVATDLAILGIGGELPLTILTATLPLARLGRARSLLRRAPARERSRSGLPRSPRVFENISTGKKQLSCHRLGLSNSEY